MADGTSTVRGSVIPLLGYRCCECKAVTRLSDLNDEMVCEDCSPRPEMTWVPRRALLEG